MKNIFEKIKQTAIKIPKKIQLLILILTVVIIAAIILVVVTTCGRRRTGEIITLTYANWNLGHNRDNALELRMIQSFMDEHPNIRVVIDQHLVSPWTESLTNAVIHNRLPDVFMVEDISVSVANGWLMDITSNLVADLDFFDLPRGVQESMRIGGIMYAIPFAQTIHGYFVNNDLLRTLDIEPTPFGVSANRLVDAIRAATDPNIPSIGTNNVLPFVEWYPSAVNNLLGFFAFDGFGFALNSPEMLEAVRIATELYNGGYAFYGIPTDTAASYFPAGYALGAFRDGQMAFLYGGSWLNDIMINQMEFDWQFIGVPGGRSIVTLEALGVSSRTNHPEEAYLLARWMGHGTEGSLRRLEYAREMGLVPGSLPVSQNREVLESLFEIMPVPGLREIYESMDTALIDGLRVLPGYMQARYTAPTGIDIYGTTHTDVGVDTLIRYSIAGYIYFPDHSDTAEDVARHQLNIAQDIFR